MGFEGERLGKDRGQEEVRCTKRIPGSGREWCAHVPAADRKQSQKEAKGAVHQLAQPHQGAVAERGVPAL